MKAGIALNPATPLCAIDEVLGEVDKILIMSVNPGFGGQSFLPFSLSKIQRLRQKLETLNLNQVEIEVDGGISPETIGLVLSAGANVFVAGSAIFYSEDYEKTIRQMREGMDKASALKKKP